MPKVPMVRLDDWDGVQLPRVMSVSDAPLTRGRHVLAHGIADAGRAAAGIADVAMRVRERRVREEETALVDSWRMTYGGVWEGRPGDTPEAEPVRGVRDWGEDEGSAVDAMRETWLTWRDDPDGPYMKASAEARRRADRRLMLETNRIFSLAAQKDLASAETRRRTAAEASLATGLRTASLYAHDDGLFEGAAADAADAAARLKAGRFLANPSETDPEKLRFTSESGAALYHAARAEAMDRLNHTRALTLIKSAGTAEDEARAAAGIAAAAGVAEMLPPALKADTLAALESARAKRLDGMLGHARAEPDLDKRERLARIAEDAAKAYGAGGKLLGAVTEEANRIRAGAQEAENRLALAALAEGREYEPGDNPRKANALAFAKPKYEKLAAQAHRKAQDGNALFIGSMVGAGVWVDPEGNIRPVTLDESRGLLVAQLEAGNIGLRSTRSRRPARRRATSAPPPRSPTRWARTSRRSGRRTAARGSRPEKTPSASSAASRSRRPRRSWCRRWKRLTAAIPAACFSAAARPGCAVRPGGWWSASGRSRASASCWRATCRSWSTSWSRPTTRTG